VSRKWCIVRAPAEETRLGCIFRRLERREEGLVAAEAEQTSTVPDRHNSLTFVKRLLFGRMSQLVLVSLAIPFLHCVFTRAMH
jgi:hypothetical protein